LGTLEGCWQHCVDAGLIAEYAVLGPDFVRLALVAGYPDRAAEVTETVKAAFGDSAVPSFAAAALYCQGLVADDEQRLIAAAEHYAIAGRPLATAQAWTDAGTRLVSQDPAAAIALLRRAATTFDQLTARRDLARCQATLRELGIRTGVRGRRPRARTGWESLTSTERQVIALVAEGLSNPAIGDRLFVSRRTVQSHLAHIFTKLNVSSRAQLAAEAARH
jgi:DNA-binding CsgD family transcriptional regulator